PAGYPRAPAGLDAPERPGAAAAAHLRSAPGPAPLTVAALCAASVQRARRARDSIPATCVAVGGVVLTGWRAWNRRAVLPGPPATDAPGAQDDARGRGQ